MNACMLAVALLGTPLVTSAAGFGKMTVLSNLGQPFSAEIDLVSVQPDEAETLNVRLASPEAFQERGVDYAGYMRSLRFKVEKRDSGRYFIRVNSSQAINDPYVDFLVELVWKGGKIVRQYTDILDPADYKPTSAKSAPVVMPPKAATTSTAKPAASEKPVATTTEKPVAKAAAADEAAPGSHRVARGESAGSIAREYRPSGVSLDQMLLALYKKNRGAFQGQNINHLKAGSVLKLPNKQEAGATAPAKATREVRALTANFGAYKQSLAAEVAKSEPTKSVAATSMASGKVTAKTEDRAAPATTGPRDVVRVSPGEAAKGNAAAQQRIRSLEEEAAAREKALKEANDRVSQLEQNIAKMQKLLELRSQSGAKLEQNAAQKPAVEPVKPTKVEAPKTEPVKPVEPPKVEPVKPVAASKPVASPAQAVVTKASSPVASVANASAVTASAPASMEAAKPVAVPETKKTPAPAIVEEPMEEEEGLPWGMIGGAAAALALLGGGFFYLRNRRSSRPSFEDSVLTGGDLKSNTVLGSVGASIIDTASSTDNSFFTDFSREGLGSIDTDEVDPIAEAEVYMAYGRDAQAEEILKDALIKDASRQEVRLKLMEIYALRKNVANFEMYATELHAATGGKGPLWEKASAMGRELDPANSLYGGESEVASAPVAEAPAAAVPAEPVVEESQPVSEEAADLDFEIGTAIMEAPVVSAPAAAPEVEEAPAMDFAMDLGSLDLPTEAPQAPAPVVEEDEGSILDFQFDMSSLEVPAAAVETTRMQAPSFDEAPAMPDLSAMSEEPVVEEAAPVDLGMDFSGLDLNLEAESVEVMAPVAEEVEVPDLGAGLNFNLDALDDSAMGGVEDPVETKLDLARAYIEMGDTEGAREILNEAMAEGTDAQKQQAQGLLSQL